MGYKKWWAKTLKDILSKSLSIDYKRKWMIISEGILSEVKWKY